MIKQLFDAKITLPVAIVFGLLFGALNFESVNSFANAVSEIFIRLLKMVSLPIIFLSLVSTACSMENVQHFKGMGLRVIRYTLLTTVLAASIALILFLVINPVHGESFEFTKVVTLDKTSYLDYLLKSIPSNIIKPFADNHVIGVMIIAILFSLSILALPLENRKPLHSLFHSLFLVIMKITTWVVRLMPLAVFAFLVLLVRDMKAGLDIKTVAYYLLCVVLANLIQAFFVLPLLLKSKSIEPLKLAGAMSPALSLAFFSKSSSATIPLAIQCATERANIKPGIARFVLPLCTTINMNGCAAFILTTVLFVSMSHGMVWSFPEMIGWVFIATIAAIGNAGVPMGCFFLSGAILASMNVPLHLLGVILPFYTLIDMLETAINVWSDCSVTAIVEKEVTRDEANAKVKAESKTIPLFE